MCSRKVVVKPLIFRLFRTLPVSQRLRFLCLIIMACETSGIKLQGPSLCIRTHGWKFLSKKVDRLLTKNPLSETNVEFGFFVSSFLGQLFCFRISPCWSQHRIGPCKFIPAVSHAIIIKWRTVIFYYGSGIWLSELNRNLTTIVVIC